MHGKSAGYIRNEQMAQNADALVAFWDGKSKGTKNTNFCIHNPEKSRLTLSTLFLTAKSRCFQGMNREAPKKHLSEKTQFNNYSQ